MRIPSQKYRPKYRQAAGASHILSEAAEALAAQEANPVRTPPPEVSPWHALADAVGDVGKPLAVRWDVKKFPLKVAIELCPDVSVSGKGSSASKLPVSQPLETYLFRVLKEWEAASYGLIRFVPAGTPGSEQYRGESSGKTARETAFGGAPDNAETVDIRISWAQEPVRGRNYEVGHTRRTVQGRGWITGVEITLLTAPLIDRHLNPTQRLLRLRATILHEIGHALGLEHSQAKGDVMHHRGWKNSQITLGDSRRLLELYQEDRSRLF